MILLCVMKRNCVCADIWRTRSQKRSVFGSSSGASTSSSRQKGAGFSLKSENTSAIAVSAFSPPESSWIDWFFLPGRLREHLQARVEDLLAGELEARLAAAEERREHLAGSCAFTSSNVSCSSSRVSRSMRLIAASSVSTACGEVGGLRVEEVLALARGVELRERGEVHRAQRRDLLGEALDLGLHARGAHALLDLLGHLLARDARLLQLLRVLLGVRRGFLLLQRAAR